jgi:hypothetical protein
MKSLDYTLNRLPGEPLEEPKVSLPFENPTNILSQTKSDITTNPFVKEAPFKPVTNPNFSDINKGVSVTFIGFLDDLFNKPETDTWTTYLPKILNKDQRYNYFAVLLFFIAIYILLIK